MPDVTLQFDVEKVVHEVFRTPLGSIDIPPQCLYIFEHLCGGTMCAKTRELFEPQRYPYQLPECKYDGSDGSEAKALKEGEYSKFSGCIAVRLKLHPIIIRFGTLDDAVQIVMDRIDDEKAIILADLCSTIDGAWGTGSHA